MTVEELIDQLQMINPEMEVRFASYPKYSIVIMDNLYFDYERSIVYLAEDFQMSLLPKCICEDLDWENKKK